MYVLGPTAQEHTVYKKRKHNKIHHVILCDLRNSGTEQFILDTF